MSDVIAGIPKITETYADGSPKKQEQEVLDRESQELTTTETTYAQGKGADKKGKRKSRTRITRKQAPGPPNHKARWNKVREIIEEFDDDGDQVVKETEIIYDGSVNEIQKEKYEREYYTDPKGLKEEVRYSWDGKGWVKESDYKFDRDGTQHKN